MSLQMVQYRSSDLRYPGNDELRNTTQKNKQKCGSIKVGVIKCEDHVKRVSYAQYLGEKQPRGAKKTRLCARNMMLLKKHLNSMKRVHPSSCQMCGKNLGFMDRVELFGVKKSQFKKANAVEVKKNKIHMKKWMRKYEKDMGNTD